jgi:hypothetical protein
VKFFMQYLQCMLQVVAYSTLSDPRQLSDAFVSS